MRPSGRLEGEARAQLAAEGFRAAAVRVKRSVDCRYQGQSFELTVPVDGADARRSSEAFGREHERTYGHRAGADEPVEIVSLRVVGQGLSDRPRVPDRVQIERPRNLRCDAIAPRVLRLAGRAGWRRLSSHAPTSPPRGRARR